MCCAGLDRDRAGAVHSAEGHDSINCPIRVACPTISSRLSYMDFSEETTAHFNEVARSMLTNPWARARLNVRPGPNELCKGRCLLKARRPPDVGHPG